MVYIEVFTITRPPFPHWNLKRKEAPFIPILPQIYPASWPIPDMIVPVKKPILCLSRVSINTFCHKIFIAPRQGFFMQVKSGKPDALVHNIPLALSSTMKAEIEMGAVKYGISAQGFIRMSIREKLERDKL